MSKVSLENLPFGLKIIVAPLSIFLLLSLIFYLFFLRPEVKELKNLKNELENLEYKVKFQQNFLPLFARLESEIKKIDKDLSIIEFKPISIKDFKEKLQKKCTDYNLNLIYLKPDFNLTENNQLKIEVAIRGNFENFLKFLENFLKLGYIRKIDALKLNKELDTLNIEFTSYIEVSS